MGKYVFFLNLHFVITLRNIDSCANLFLLLAAQSEVNKLQQHLSLLKQEYAKLQAKYTELERKYDNIAAESGENNDSFAGNILKTVSKLLESETYSDIKIKFSNRLVHAHKLVLNARSELWNESMLSEKHELDWSDFEADVAEIILVWLYTSDIKLATDELTLKVIRKAYEFKLTSLVEQCERILINHVDVRNCVKFYSVAEEIDAANLREYCSGLISAHWDELNSSDFEHMSGPLLYKMLKSKTQLPLHSAVRIQREDVVFLCLVENSSKVSQFLIYIYF